jgi:Fe-Mn family superoxide dismutase
MTLTRRTLLAATGAAIAGGLLARSEAQAAQSFELPPLPYAEDALQPTISARTVGLHYGKHHKGYFTKLNKLVEGKPYAALSLDEVVVKAHGDGETGIFNNAAQAWNHVLYWDQFKGGPAAPEGEFQAALERDFGGLDGLKKAVAEESDKVFGTGWVWLVKNGDKLEVLGMQDAGNPLTEGKRPLLGIDVWEHAYYLDYENRRGEHVKAVLDNLVNWRFVGERLS